MSDPATAEPSPRTTSLKVCLAASGGGHVRQLLDLREVWSEHDYFFVTEDTALGQTLAREHRTYFVPHFAWGQTRFGSPLKMLTGALVSLFRSLAFMSRERPDVIISTGAGAVIFPVIWARLFGARVVVIESFARFDGPSLFGRIAAPFAHDVVVQSPKLARFYPRAEVFDPFRRLEGEIPPKEDLLFATVGATVPFDRLVDTVDAARRDGEIPERIIVQTGVGGRSPEGIETSETLPFDEVEAILQRARIVVCHGGTGSLITALRAGCQVIAMPRLSRLQEHYDDHQSEITAAFRDRGLVLVAHDEAEFRKALATARTRDAVLATTDPVELRNFLRTRLSRIRRPAAAKSRKRLRNQGS